MDGPDLVNGFIARGYSPIHAAALVGHILQESGGNTEAFNPKEDAHGLLQWRQDRWDNLQALAKARGASPTDPNVQMDFVSQEMAGPEAKAGAAFRASGDLPTASAALKRYIRFGDNSDAVRLNNARGLLSNPAFAQAGMIPQASPQAPNTTAGPATAGVSSSPAAAPAVPPSDEGQAELMAQLANIPKMLAAQQASQEFAPPAPVTSNLRARMAAIAAARQGSPT